MLLKSSTFDGCLQWCPKGAGRAARILETNPLEGLAQEWRPAVPGELQTDRHHTNPLQGFQFSIFVLVRLDFVELPEEYAGLYYCNILAGVIRGALEMVCLLIHTCV